MFVNISKYTKHFKTYQNILYKLTNSTNNIGTEMGAGKRILEIIDYLKVSKNKFSTKYLGLSASTKVDHVINGRNDLTPEFAKEICDVVPEIRYDWLYKNEGEMLNQVIEKNNSKEYIDNIELNNLANAVIEHEDALIKIPKIQKVIERHALIMLNDKMPDLIEKIYSTIMTKKS